MLIRHFQEARSIPETDLFPALKKAFQTIGTAQVSRSGEDAKRLQLLRPSDVVEINSQRLLFRAKQEVIRLAEAGYVRPEPEQNIPALGNSALAV